MTVAATSTIELAEPRKKSVTSADVCALLRTRYSHPEWALCFEVANATGTNASRYADAVAMNLYPSRGLALHGFEVKVSKSDFMSEISKPDKSVAVQQYCDYWWLVAPASAVDESLIPKTWGWLRVDGSKLVSVKQAPPLDAKPVTRAFMASLVRRANEADSNQVEALVRKRTETIYAENEKRIKTQVEGLSRKATDAIKQYDDLKAKIGVDDYNWINGEDVARAIRFVRAAGIAGTYGSVKTIQADLKRAHDRIDKAFEKIVGKQEELPLDNA